MLSAWTYFIVLIILFECFEFSVAENNPVVQTKYGTFRGTSQRAISGKEYYAFLGIPYAMAPIENLRFKAPSPPKPLKGTYDATKEGEFCIQFLHGLGVIGEENCLFLNIYTNKLINTTESSERRPVMFIIHGGGFIIGTGSSIIYGPDYLVNEDIIIVTINYRLGILGFLSLSEAGVPGNNGLKDQAMALQWVRNNIAYFGGDPNNVILNGESAGAASVHLHFFSPLSKGLFSGAIIQSGSGLHSWACVDPSVIRRKSFQVGGRLNCSTSDSQKLLLCLKEASAGKIVSAVGEDFSTLKLPEIMAFVPTQEEGYSGDEPVFLPGKVKELLSSGKFHDVPFIIGVNSRETVLLPDAYEAFIGPMNNEIAKAFVEDSISVTYPTKSKEITEKIWTHYIGDQPWTQNVKDNLTKFTSDLLIVRDTLHAVRLHTEKSHSPVYVYRFSYEGELELLKELVPTKLKGVSHAEDLFYMFRLPFGNDFEKDSDEMTTMKRLIKMWSNFAWTKNPIPRTDNILSVKWIPASKMNYVYLNFDKNISMEQDMHKESITFLDNMLEAY